LVSITGVDAATTDPDLADATASDFSDASLLGIGGTTGLEAAVSSGPIFEESTEESFSAAKRGTLEVQAVDLWLFCERAIRGAGAPGWKASHWIGRIEESEERHKSCN